MKKIIVALVALVSFASAESYVPVFSTEPIFGTYIPVSELQGADGIDGIDGANGVDGLDGLSGIDGADGTNGTDGADGTDGTDGIDGRDFDNMLAKRIQASANAMASVELNPDHEGLSIGGGYSKVSGINAGAVGVMYAWQIGQETSLGINVKGYKAEGGHKGASAGLTVGF